MSKNYNNKLLKNKILKYMKMKCNKKIYSQKNCNKKQKNYNKNYMIKQTNVSNLKTKSNN